MNEALLAGLRACLSEALPTPDQRAALLAEAERIALPELHDVAKTISTAKTRSELAVAAARGLRVLMQAEALAAQASEELAPPARGASKARAKARAERREAVLVKKQAEAIEQGKAKTLLEQPVESLPGLGRALGLALRSRGLATLEDLIWLLPLGYHDERDVTPLAELAVGQRQVTEGRVVSARMGGRRMAEVWLEDPHKPPGQGARLRLAWFRVPGGLLQRFREGMRFRVAGNVESYCGALGMTHPQTERVDGEAGAQAAGIVPRYPVVPGVPPKPLRKLIGLALARAAFELPEALPAAIREREQLGTTRAALTALHAPPAGLADQELLRWNEARTEHHARLAFEEFFLLELALQRRRIEEQGVSAEPLPRVPAALERARAALPFALTAAQARVIDEISADLEASRPMRRLLQGDVGSGKTAVAMLSAAHTIAAGAQVAFMAPTEILAEQHFRSLSRVAEAMGLRAALVLGGERASHRQKTRKALAEGRVDLAIGTHALLSEGVVFARLGLVIVDEQHRFGVGQRLRLVGKSAPGTAPHLLVMTATPIPRTLALAAYGDLASSVIDELPPGRIPQVTRAYPREQRGEALRQLERALETGGQAYVVCPTIEPSEEGPEAQGVLAGRGPELNLRSALETYEELAARWPQYGVALLHGALGNDDKQAALARFGSGQARVLVATTIVEVGLDVPKANCILIENAERFGLAQLHQLRGRVGRGGQRSACLLVHEAASEIARERIRALCETHDGFRLAEEDLRLRGPGELFGRKQSGLPGFRFGDLRRDQPLLARARELAHETFERDPQLELPEHAGARHALERLQDSERAVVKEEAG
jgi:ATP-dependent DNA helicase RecG